MSGPQKQANFLMVPVKLSVYGVRQQIKFIGIWLIHFYRYTFLFTSIWMYKTITICILVLFDMTCLDLTNCHPKQYTAFCIVDTYFEVSNHVQVHVQGNV